MGTKDMLTMRFRVTKARVTLLLAFAFLVWHPGFIGSETLQMTTYYPAPYGGYVSILTTNQTVLARDAGRVGIGTAGPVDKLGISGGGIDIAGGGIMIDGGQTIQSRGRMHIYGQEILYLLNRSGVIVSTAWGGNGNLTVEGSQTVGGNLTVSGATSLNGALTVNGWTTLNSNLTVNGTVYGLCQRVAYTYGGNQACSGGYNIMGVTGDGSPRIVGFLPSGVTTSGAGRYIVLGEDWGGTMICCRIN